jgi:hypothetical protein
MLAIFFNDDSPVIELNHEIDISSIREGISDIISLYRDSVRMYIGLNGNVQLSGTDCYKVDGVGRVEFKYDFGYDKQFCFTFLDDEHLFHRILFSDAFMSRGVYTDGGVSQYYKSVKQIISLIRSSLEHIYIYHLGILFNSRFGGLDVTAVGRYDVNHLVEGKYHSELCDKVGFSVTYLTFRIGGMFSHFEIVPIAFDTCGTADDVLDMLEMLAYCRKVISDTDTYKTLMSHGYISYIPYFEDREDVSCVNSVMHHINDDFKYYRLCDLCNGITCRTLPSNVYTVRAMDCMIYFTVSCKLFLHKKMGSSFFNPNVLDKLLYDALYAYGKYIGYLS